MSKVVENLLLLAPRDNEDPEIRAAMIDAAGALATTLSALKEAYNHIMTEAEARNYDPPVRLSLVADIEFAIAKAEGRDV